MLTLIPLATPAPYDDAMREFCRQAVETHADEEDRDQHVFTGVALVLHSVLTWTSPRLTMTDDIETVMNWTPPEDLQFILDGGTFWHVMDLLASAVARASAACDPRVFQSAARTILVLSACVDLTATEPNVMARRRGELFTALHTLAERCGPDTRLHFEQAADAFWNGRWPDVSWLQPEVEDEDDGDTASYYGEDDDLTEFGSQAGDDWQAREDQSGPHAKLPVITPKPISPDTTD